MSNNSTISNSKGINVGQARRDAYQSINQSFTDSQVVEANGLLTALQELKEIVEHAVEKGEAVDPHRTAEDFGAIAKEVSAEKPQSSRLEAYGNILMLGIEKTSKSISHIADGITKIRSIVDTLV